MRGIRRASVQSCLGAGLVLAMAGSASANPIISPPADTAIDGVLELFVSNLPIDILLFSVLLLLVLWKMNSPIKAAPKDSNMLIARVVIGGLVIAAIGALIDFYTFFTYYDSNVAERAGYYLVYQMTMSRLVVAAAMVFASVCAVSLAIVRARLVPSLVVAGTIAVFNFLAWVVGDYGFILKDGEGMVALAGVVFLFVPPVLFGLAHMHKKGVKA